MEATLRQDSQCQQIHLDPDQQALGHHIRPSPKKSTQLLYQQRCLANSTLHFLYVTPGMPFHHITDVAFLHWKI